MEWHGEGLLIAARPYGEADALAEIFCAQRGLIRGFVKGGLSKRHRALMQPGNQVTYQWRARLETNLGRFTLDLVASPLGQIIDDGPRLSALQTALAVTQSTLYEREPAAELYAALTATIDLIIAEASTPALWAAAIAKLELLLLSTAGFGLDLEACAATGATQSLIYVSPKSGRAVSASAGAPYRDKLLPLPPFMRLPGLGEPEGKAAFDALIMTGFFLNREIWSVRLGSVPEARERFMASLEREGFSKTAEPD